MKNDYQNDEISDRNILYLQYNNVWNDNENWMMNEDVFMSSCKEGKGIMSSFLLFAINNKHICEQF